MTHKLLITAAYAGAMLIVIGSALTMFVLQGTTLGVTTSQLQGIVAMSTFTGIVLLSLSFAGLWRAHDRVSS